MLICIDEQMQRLNSQGLRSPGFHRGDILVVENDWPIIDIQEFFGRSGSGKTEILYNMALACAMPPSFESLVVPVIFAGFLTFLSSETTFESAFVFAFN